MLATLVVRAVILHEDASVRGAPVHALVAVALGLFVAFTGRSALMAVTVRTTAYVLLSTATAALL